MGMNDWDDKGAYPRQGGSYRQIEDWPVYTCVEEALHKRAPWGGVPGRAAKASHSKACVIDTGPS